MAGDVIQVLLVPSSLCALLLPSTLSYYHYREKVACHLHLLLSKPGIYFKRFHFAVQKNRHAHARTALQNMSGLDSSKTR